MRTPDKAGQANPHDNKYGRQDDSRDTDDCNSLVVDDDASGLGGAIWRHPSFGHPLTINT